MRRLVQSLAVGVLVVYLFSTGTATAKSTEEQLVEKNREAMAAYNNLDVNQAISILEEAISTAQGAGISGPLLATTYLNLGIVQIGGLGDKQKGLDSFVKACCVDPGTVLDPLLSTPDIQAQFQRARQTAASGDCDALGVAPADAPMPTPMQPLQAEVQPGVTQILHQPLIPQASQAPLPIYAEIANPEDFEKLVLFFRGLGMDDYKSVDMIEFGSGYAYQISCHEVWEPRVHYYLQALDDDDRVIASAGTAQAPLEAPIVSTLEGPGAALPGSTAPGRCVETECPPGVTGDEREKPLYHGVAEYCDSDRDCQPGLMCDGSVCNLPGALEQPDLIGPGRPARTDFARGFIQIGLSLGLSRVSAGMITDTPPPAVADNVYVTDPNDPYFLTLRRDTPWVADADSYERIPVVEGGMPDSGNFAEAYRKNPITECPADGTVSGPDKYWFMDNDRPYYPTRYCARINAPGIVLTPAMRVAIGYFVLPRLSLALILRYQFDAGEGTLANMLLGGRAEYLFLGGEVATGFSMSCFLGVTAGQIQLQPPPEKANQPAPYIISGIGGAHLGFNARYRIHRNFGLVFAPEFDLQFPNTLIHSDLTLSAEADF